jgi:hypothetical protein
LNVHDRVPARIYNVDIFPAEQGKIQGIAAMPVEGAMACCGLCATALEKLLQIGFEQDFDQIHASKYRSELLGRATSRSTCDAH